MDMRKGQTLYIYLLLSPLRNYMQHRAQLCVLLIAVASHLPAAATRLPSAPQGKNSLLHTPLPPSGKTGSGKLFVRKKKGSLPFCWFRFLLTEVSVVLEVTN